VKCGGRLNCFNIESFDALLDYSGSLIRALWRRAALGGSLVTTARRMLKLRMEETAFRYGG
jgi:hypothetical protein